MRALGRRNINRTTIFKQLTLNIIVWVVIALMGLGIMNYFHTKRLLEDSNSAKNKFISDEITKKLEFQDMALELVEERLDKQLESYSHELVTNYFKNTTNIESANLEKIREELGMDSKQEDIYVIRNDGVVVNTTFKNDLHKNFFSFGDEFKSYLLNVLISDDFHSEKFSIELSTSKLRKYTYQSTLDGNYIIELGVYSKKANNIIDFIRNSLKEISKEQQSVKAVDLFVSKDQPVPLDKNAILKENHSTTLLHVFNTKRNAEIIEKEDGHEIHYEYRYMDRKNTDLYKGAVIRIITDREHDNRILMNELIKSILFFVGTLLIVVFIIYRKTKSITYPIKKLVDNVTRITGGNLHERADVLGNNEITSLSEQFNLMLEELEASYKYLEQKVEDRTKEIRDQKEQLQEQQNNIMDSIRYAKRIQNAILPPDSYVQKVMPNSFILHKPKDIVSGDFYWVNDVDGKVMFAAVDCTGHGVPGAFMSIVGNHQLNYAVNVRNARTPAETLNALNQGVTDSLRQTQQGSSNVKDGMDIALCSVDFENKKLEFAGAFNPLYLVRDGELMQFKGDKFPIGAFLGEELKKFENHEIDLKVGDTIYIFSDGYADQFGGPQGRKFMYKQFKDLILSISHEEMAEQKRTLEETIEEWMGNEEQVDDIIIIGLRIK